MFSGFEQELPTEHEYHGFHVFIADRAHMHWAIETTDGTALPDALEGKYTNADRAKEAINAHLKIEPSTKVYE